MTPRSALLYHSSKAILQKPCLGKNASNRTCAGPDGWALDSDFNSQLTPGQAGRNPGRLQPGGSRRRSERIIAEELDDPRHEPDIGREVPLLPRVDRRRVRAEQLGDVRLTETQVQPARANDRRASSARSDRRNPLVFVHLAEDGKKGPNDSRFNEADGSDIRRYIKLGPLGRVFSAEERHVLLIDEIDKTDIEFPNDLLRELDEMRFTIIETGEEIVAKQRPVVLITSNNEKELPDAFLRRCIFHFIEFSDPTLMRQIVEVHHPHLEAKLPDQVLIKFYWLREQSELRKKPSTAELVDWISALMRAGVTLDKIEAHIPFVGALLKKEQDVEALTQFDQKSGRYPTKWADLGPRYNQ
jgi:hypothetical protein